jgi:glyoxalase/bleomycin resistance protein/dioxygenase superfamily protein
VTNATPSGLMTAILPCNDLNASECFYNRLGFSRPDHEKPQKGEPDTYRKLSNGKGGHLHLTEAVEGWLIPGRNPFGLYLRVEEVDAVAAEFARELAGTKEPEDKLWGMYEFSLSDPDETLVRVGWPTRLRSR